MRTTRAAKKIMTEIHLNRSGINTIEVPHRMRMWSAGAPLDPVQNRGAPIHITATTSNAGMFTDFFHENMYVIDDVVLGIPLRKECAPGFFDIDIIAGYGAMKAALKVEVIVKPTRGELTLEKEPPIQPEVRQAAPPDGGDGNRPCPVQHLVLYQTGNFNLAAFIALIVGALFVWYRQT